MTTYEFLKRDPGEHRAGLYLRAAQDAATAGSKRAGVRVTVEIANERGARVHRTLVVRPWVSQIGAPMLSVEVAGTADWSTGTRPVRVAVVNVARGTVTPARDERGAAPLLQYAAYAALRYLWTGEGAWAARNGSVEVTEEERCAHCGIALDDPESKRRGLGPVCARKATGSRAIPVAAR